ncbi:MAG: hypothetical protein H6668_00575 [Ardenticatenaceae bacterium]|nr:hypothetical protein [Ardenticatenaceae bacterium]
MARQLGILTAVTTLITLPWLLKNWLTTGNPVYPFFFNSGLHWDVWRSWSYAAGTKRSLAAASRAPFEATILGSSGSQYFDATIGPFVLGGLMLLPFVWRKLQPREKTAGIPLLWHQLPLFWLWGMAQVSTGWHNRGCCCPCLTPTVNFVRPCLHPPSFTLTTPPNLMSTGWCRSP